MEATWTCCSTSAAVFSCSTSSDGTGSSSGGESCKEQVDDGKCNIQADGHHVAIFVAARGCNDYYTRRYNMDRWKWTLCYSESLLAARGRTFGDREKAFYVRKNMVIESVGPLIKYSKLSPDSPPPPERLTGKSWLVNFISLHCRRSENHHLSGFGWTRPRICPSMASWMLPDEYRPIGVL